jgi:hypothetical protein
MSHSVKPFALKAAPAIIERLLPVQKLSAETYKEQMAKVGMDTVYSHIYRDGEQLQPWQRAFVTVFLKHRETYGKAHLLLADEVGQGKTLSLAASVMISALLDDSPALIQSVAPFGFIAWRG